MSVNKSLLGSTFTNTLITDREEDPASSLLNLADVMLVLAAGLMVAVISFWNVDLSQAGADSSKNLALIPLESELERTQIVGDVSALEDAYAEVGTIYQDQETGQLYVSAPDGSINLASK